MLGSFFKSMAGFTKELLSQTVDYLDEAGEVVTGALVGASSKINHVLDRVFGKYNYKKPVWRKELATERVIRDVPLVDMGGGVYFSPLLDMVLEGPLKEQFTSDVLKSIGADYSTQRVFTQLQAEKLERQVLSWILTNGIPVPVMPTDGELEIAFPGKKVIKRQYNFVGKFDNSTIYRAVNTFVLSMLSSLCALSAVAPLISASAFGLNPWVMAALALSFLIVRLALDSDAVVNGSDAIATNVAASSVYTTTPSDKKRWGISAFVFLLATPAVVLTGISMTASLGSIMVARGIPAMLSYSVSGLLGGFVSLVSQLGVIAGLDKFGLRLTNYQAPDFLKSNLVNPRSSALSAEAVSAIERLANNCAPGASPSKAFKHAFRVIGDNYRGRSNAQKPKIV